MIKKTHTHTHEGTSYASGTIILMITRYCIKQQKQKKQPFRDRRGGNQWEDTRVILRRAGMFRRRRCCWNQFETSMCKTREREKKTHGRTL